MLRLENCRIMNGDYAVEADLEISPGACAAVIGPSGAGKSTLVEAIAGFLPVTRGRIFWNGSDLTNSPPGKRPVAMLFQDGNLFPHLTVAQNVGLGLHANLRLSQSERSQVEAALERVGLSGMGGRKPAALSGGQQSRVALARVLVQGRQILLLDEPFAALGPALKAGMLDLVAELTRESGATVLMVSHDPDDARRIADQVVLVADGKAHPPEPAAELLDNPPPALKAYLG
ncbi:ATP-binding cassette domain-containing protein [Leisingera daeponensis]|uniref:ATP-binding cassette domain-containing protein n=1 Tax=Leisingera daeponensis TaxID=405746 RepID=A0ABS7NGH3_9RHOB|nr:ATP-binding cassette domain-containing protein [Leisingera daeponensis]MBY6056506.1 ATP-binding cassette domain-containing protein [Leisingera daeponensis]MBY6140275.1 ATP-binding cassette domain-containing protein [Leisingera daeponensis]